VDRVKIERDIVHRGDSDTHQQTADADLDWSQFVPSTGGEELDTEIVPIPQRTLHMEAKVGLE
jgi:hypothetical protein